MDEEIIIEGQENKDIINKQYKEQLDKALKSKDFLIFVSYIVKENGGVTSACLGNHAHIRGLALYMATKKTEKAFLKQLLKDVKGKNCDTCSNKDICDEDG